MPLEDLLISTGVDNLIKLVHEKGRVEMKDAAKALKLPLQTIEDWAHILEAEGVIKIEYKLTQIFLRWAYMNEEQHAKSAQRVEDKKSEVVSKLQSIDSTLTQGVQDIERLREGVRTLDIQNRDQLKKVSSDKEEVERLHAQLEDTVLRKRERVLELKEDMRRLKEEVDALGQVVSADPAGGAADIGQKIELLDKLEGRIEARIAAYDAKAAQLQEQMASLRALSNSDKTLMELEETKTAVAELKFAKAELGKAVQGMASELKGFDAQTAALEGKLAEISARKTGTAAQKKAIERIEQLVKESTKDKSDAIGGMRNDLEVIKKQIEVLSHAQYQYQTIKAHMGSLQSQYNQESEDIERLAHDVEDAQKQYAQDLERAKQNLEEQEAQYQALEEKSKNIGAVLERVERLKQEGEALSTRLRGVIKEAQVVSLAAPPGVSATPMSAQAQAGGAETVVRGPGKAEGSLPDDNIPPGLMQRIALTTAEEEEFERKRNELRSLIEKMWDEEHRPRA